MNVQYFPSFRKIHPQFRAFGYEQTDRQTDRQTETQRQIQREKEEERQLSCLTDIATQYGKIIL